MLNETQNILDRLERADRVHQKEAGARLLLRSVKYVCAAVLAMFVLDVVFHLTAGWRLTLLLGLIAAAVGIGAISWYLAFVRRNRLEHIARVLETHDPALGSRLINFLQLQGQTEDPKLSSLTRDLARQAVESYAGDLRPVEMERLARSGELPLRLKYAALALGAFILLLAIFFRVSALELARFADPFGDHPAYSFTHLEIVQPGAKGTNVLYGKGLVVKAKASGHQPKEVFLTAFPPGKPEQAFTLPMFDKASVGYDQLLDNIRGELLVFAHTKDRASVSRQAHIGVVLTPQIDRAFVRIAPPAYTGLKTDEKVYTFKGVQALAGSTVKFRIQSNRPLRDGLIELSSADREPERIPMKRSAENEVAGEFTVTDSSRLRFSVTDISGLPSQGNFEGSLTVTHDLPPEITIAEPAQDAFVAVDFRLKAQIAANDDYGIRTVRFHRGLNGVYSAPKVFTYGTVVRDVRESEAFNFADLGIQPGDIVSFFAEAVDTAPEPHMSRSQTVRLMVISVEDYNNFLREQTDVAEAEAKYSELNSDLQELIGKQRELSETAQKLKNQIAKMNPAQRAASAQALDGLLAKQNELNHQLNQHAGRMENFVRENPVYDIEAEFQQMLDEQARNIRNSAATNSSASTEIARKSSPESGSRQLSPEMLEDFKRESDEQIARLAGAHDEAEREIAQSMEGMEQMQELLKDFNQFESLYRTQQELAEQAKAYNRAGALNREDQLALKELASVEKQVGDLLRQLEGKLRDDVNAAEKLFPKASKSGRDLADQLEERRLRPLAERATGEMLSGNGEQSLQLAERLRDEMAALFRECSGGNCPSSNELDAHLSLQRKKPGNNFAQMARSRKFGTARGSGRGKASGEGESGMSGYAVVDGSNMKVLGNEMSSRRNGALAKQSSRVGKGPGAVAGSANGTMEKPDVIQGLKPINRQSGAVASETVIEEYNDVVENYFKTITTKKKP